MGELIDILTAELAEQIKIVNDIKKGNYATLNDYTKRLDGQELPTDKHNATTA